MANYKGHISGAVICLALVLVVLTLLPFTWLAGVQDMLANWQWVWGLFVTAILFGLWPDIDTNSKAQDIFFGFAFILNVILIIYGRFEVSAYLGLIAMTPILAKHRGWTHKKWAMIVVPLPILIVPYLYQPNKLLIGIAFYLSAVVGYFSHLLLDGLITKRVRIKGN